MYGEIICKELNWQKASCHRVPYLTRTCDRYVWVDEKLKYSIKGWYSPKFDFSVHQSKQMGLGIPSFYQK